MPKGRGFTASFDNIALFISSLTRKEPILCLSNKRYSATIVSHTD